MNVCLIVRLVDLLAQAANEDVDRLSQRIFGWSSPSCT
jgi:hypothetical protein